MVIDKNGIIWIATQGGGLDAFDPVTENFTNYKHLGGRNNEIRGNFIWSVLADRNNDIWIGVSGKGVDKIEQTTGKIEHFGLLEDGKDLNQENDIRCLLEDDNGNIWAGITDLGLSCINPKTKEAKNFININNDLSSLSNNMPYDLFLSSENRIWVTTFGGGINIFDPKKNNFSHINTSDNNSSIVSDLTYSIIERIPGEYWIATEYGLSIYNSQTDQIKNIVQNSYEHELISENRLRILFADSKGIIWAGTESGVEKFVTQKNFKIYSDFFDNKLSLSSAIVKTIASDNDFFWVGFIDYGLFRYSYKTKTSKHYFSRDDTKKESEVSNINAILHDSNDNLWIADWNYGLMKYDRQNDSFEKISNAYVERNRLSDNRVQRIIEGKKGVIWIGTEGGLNRYDVVKDEFIIFRHSSTDTNSLSGNSIQSQAIAFDNDSNLWLGTWSFGLNKVEFIDSTRTKANFRRWKHNPNKPGSLPNNSIISLLYDTTALWIGTFGGGLSRLDLESEKFTTYTTDDGLPNNIIFAILKDKNGNLWLSTDYGISMFDPLLETFYNYTKEDGLQDNHFFWGSAYVDKNGTFFLGGIKGINSFVPEEVKPDSTLAKPVIVDIKLFNKSIGSQRYSSLSNEVRFHYFENFISIEFAALDYSEPKNNQYKYKLEGFDKEWVFSNNFNLASYTNLAPGNYTFKLQVANSDGIWSNEILSLEIVVIPPWWKTLLARIIFIILGFSTVYSIFRIRINLLKQQKKKLETLVKERTEEVNHKNDELKEKYGEIVSQEEEIREQAEELRALSEKLKGTNQNLAQKVKERTIELENALNKAEDSQKLISSFLSNFSHEIRTPLNAIMGFSQLSSNEDISEFKKEHYTFIVEQNVQSLLLQIDNIMDVAKLHTGQYRLKKTSFSLDEVFSQVYNELKNNDKIINKKLQFKLHIENELNLTTDRDSFKGIVNNLVENAIKYTEKGTVDFGFTIEPKFTRKLANFEINPKSSVKLKLLVKDTGIGIRKEMQEIIFDPSRKIENNDKIYRGTGVGLALVKSLADKLNGTVIIKSKVNKGTSITIEIPISEIL